MKRNRLHYAIAIVAMIPLGLATRSGMVRFFPEFVGAYGGDVLWALVAYLCFGFLFPKMEIRKVAGLALIFAFAIEFSQLYQADWINAIRGTIPGKLILGRGFLWSDLVCYSVGILAGAVGEVFLNRNNFRSKKSKSGATDGA